PLRALHQCAKRTPAVADSSLDRSPQRQRLGDQYPRVMPFDESASASPWQLIGAQAPKQHIVALRPGAGVPFKPGPFEVLNGVNLPVIRVPFRELLADRIAKD